LSLTYKVFVRHDAYIYTGYSADIVLKTDTFERSN